MTRISIIIIYILFSGFSLMAQTEVQDKIILKTGEVYVGELVVHNQEMVMIKTQNGNRYQFQLSEIKEIGREKLVQLPPDSIQRVRVLNRRGNANFCGMIELTGGISQAKYTFGASPNTQFSLLFGCKRIYGQNLFLGAGLGYNTTHAGEKPATIRFLPLFLRLQNTLTSNRTAPYLGMDVGYAFALNTEYGGGALIKISAGVTHKLNYKTAFFAGAYAGVQSLSAPLTETNKLGVYSYRGKTTMRSVGIKIGMCF